MIPWQGSQDLHVRQKTLWISIVFEDLSSKAKSSGIFMIFIFQGPQSNGMPKAVEFSRIFSMDLQSWQKDLYFMQTLFQVCPDLTKNLWIFFGFFFLFFFCKNRVFFKNIFVRNNSKCRPENKRWICEEKCTWNGKS